MWYIHMQLDSAGFVLQLGFWQYFYGVTYAQFGGKPDRDSRSGLFVCSLSDQISYSIWHIGTIIWSKISIVWRSFKFRYSLWIDCVSLRPPGYSPQVDNWRYISGVTYTYFGRSSDNGPRCGIFGVSMSNQVSVSASHVGIVKRI